MLFDGTCNFLFPQIKDLENVEVLCGLIQFVMYRVMYDARETVSPSRSTCVIASPASSQEEQTKCHVMSHVEAIIHLAASLLVEKTTELQDLQVPGTRHYHGHSQQNHRQSSL